MEWEDLFKKIKEKDYSKKLNSFLDEEYKNKIVYPPRKLLFNAFNLTPYEGVKVVILGQDPYHEPNQAMGLAFSVPKGVDLPPSLQNIYKEIGSEYSVNLLNKSGDLTYLAKQGVLLLNPILSVIEHKPLSHKCTEYDEFFKDVMSFLNNHEKPIVFMLWGNNAKQYKKYIINKNHLILESVHPSPLSANRGGWFGNNHFKQANEFLKKHNLNEIDWVQK
jgi:uracil-DNA glycosylase